LRIISIIFFLFLNISGSFFAQHTVASILEKSRLYYNTHPYTRHLIFHEFKPSIAETTLRDTFWVTNCDRFLKTESNSIEKLLSGEKYFAIDHVKRKYSDFSPFPEIRKSVLETFKIYPFVDSLFLSVDEKSYSLKTDSFSYVIFNAAKQYSFNKKDYALNSFREITLTSYGAQVVSYKVGTAINIECPISPDWSFLKTYTKQAVLGKNIKVSKLEGKKVDLLLNSQGLAAINFNKTEKSKWLLLDLFYQSCYPCIMGFMELRRNGIDTMKSALNIIGVDYVASDLSTLDKFMKRYKLDFTLITGEAANYLKSVFNPNGIAPVYVLISPTGEIKRIVEGFDHQFFEKVVRWIKD
jgi:hypothetical protein